MTSRSAISFNAPATSSACARLSSWHGPAMIEIGRSLPNLTVPTVTTGAAEMSAFKGISSFRRGPCRSAQSGSTLFSPRISGLHRQLFHRRERRRHQQLADDVVDDLAVLLALGTASDPVRIGLKCRPLLFAFGERVPRDKIGQFLIGSADQRGEEAGLLDAVLGPQFQ